MKLRSSIFSFDTLAIRPRLPAGALLALVLVLLANAWAFVELRAGRLYTSVPRQMIDEAVDRLSASTGTWWLGNSTLAAGVDPQRLQAASGSSHTVVPLGSATLDVTVRLAARALSEASTAPERIVLFVTKDDLNAAGARAQVSRKYHRAMSNPSLYDAVAAALPVYSARYAITGRMRNALVEIALGRDAGAASGSGTNRKGPPRYRQLADDTDSTMLYNLGRDYRPIDVDFRPLAELAARSGTEIWLVAPPVTRSVARWQEEYASEWPWPEVVGLLAERAGGAGIRVLDYTDLLGSTTQYFKDVYHLNQSGREAFTQSLLGDFGAVSPCREQPPGDPCRRTQVAL